MEPKQFPKEMTTNGVKFVVKAENIEGTLLEAYCEQCKMFLGQAISIGFNPFRKTLGCIHPAILTQILQHPCEYGRKKK